MKWLKYKQHAHKISRNKLEKWKLNVQQIAKVYTYKTRVEQETVAKRFASANKASRAKKFYKTGLGIYVVKKQMANVQKTINTYIKIAKRMGKSAEAQTMKQLLYNEIYQLRIDYLKLSKKIATKQNKENIQYKIQQMVDYRKTHRNAGVEYAGSPTSTTKDSYDDNGTTNVSKEEFVRKFYGDELDKRVASKKETFTDVLNDLWDRCIKEGKVKELAQGVGYGYISDDEKEVISPV